MIHFYNAGAGSGKTYQLTHDLIKFLTESNGKPGEVILTTFTVKAAEELKERVRQQLLANGEAVKAAEMSNALIGTVNSICSRLVETYALEAGLTPGLRILDETTVKVFFEEFVASSLADDRYQQFSILSGRLSMYEDSVFRTKDTMKPKWPGIVKELAEKFRSYGLLSWEAVVPSMNKSISLIDQIITTTNKRKQDLVTKAKACMSVLPEAREKTPNTKLADIEYILSSFLSRQDEEDFQWYEWLKMGKMKFSNKLLAEFPGLGELISIMQQFHELPEFKADWIALTKLCYETAFDLLESYQQYKQERGLIDFADQEYLLLNMLNEHAFIREEIKAGFKMIMVDELQDSSPLQIAIFSKLQEIIDTSIWVGDPKQSIYGFRGADANLFMDTMKEVEQHYEISELNTSRRSRPDLVQSVNAIFTGLFNGMLSEKRIKLQPWDAIRERDALYDSPALHLYFFETKKMEDYFVSLAWKIKDVLASNLLVWDKAGKKTRKVLAGDIGVLFRSNADVEKMAAALSAAGIPVAVETAGFDKKAEVQWIANLLRLLINPNDSLAIANLMLLEGVVQDVEALIRLRLQHQSDLGSHEQWQSLSPISKRICEGRRLVDHMPLLQTIEYLITISDLPLYCAKWGNYEERMSVVSHLLTLASDYQEESAVLGIAAGFAGFLSYLESNTNIPASGNQEAVKLMTVHGSKGLEWPMVIPAKMNLDSNHARMTFNQVHVLQTGPFKLSAPLSGRQLIYLPWPFGATKNVPDELLPRYQLIAEELGSEQKFLQEEDRLLYVALTRARDYLVLTGDEKCNSYASLFEGVRNAKTGLFNESQWTGLKQMVQPGEKKIIHWNNLDILLEKLLLQERVPVSTATKRPKTISYYASAQEKPGVAYKSRRVSPSRLQYDQAESQQQVSITVLSYQASPLSVPGEKDLSYDAIGNIIHAAFAAWNPENTLQEREAILTQVISNFNAVSIMKAADLEIQFSHFWNYLLATFRPTRFWKEIPLQSVAEDHGELMSGFADLLLDTPEGLVLIDHKTFPGSFEKQVLEKESAFYAGKYYPQLSAYAALISKTFGKEVVKMILHYVVNGKLVEVSAVE